MGFNLTLSPPLLPQNLSAFKQISLLLLNYEINYSFSVGADREFHVWAGKAIFILKIVKSIWNIWKGHQGQDQGNGGRGLCEIWGLLVLDCFLKEIYLFGFVAQYSLPMGVQYWKISVLPDILLVVCLVFLIKQNTFLQLYTNRDL